MKKDTFTIGVLNATHSSRSGGGFHYIMTLVAGLAEESDLNVVVFYDDPEFPSYCDPSPRLSLVRLEGSESMLTKALRGFSILLGIRSRSIGRFRVIQERGVDLLISFESLIGYHLGIPFLTFVGDVMYKYYPTLPEYTWRTRLVRDLSVRMLVRHAEFTVVDSEESKRDLVKFFRADPERLKPIPLCAPPHIYQYALGITPVSGDSIAGHKLPDRFLFYPAQFWTHKNHENLVRALHVIRRDKGLEIPMMFVGAAWDSYEKIVGLLRELHMERQVHCLGYIAVEEIVALYQKTTALVFASFADYTSIPIVEAMVMGKPILCANAFSLPEQAGSAALYFDPFDVNDMAERIYRLWTDERLQAELGANGKERAKLLTPKRFSERWIALVRETILRRQQTSLVINR
jgi:glycosyltransferase involved in cell wall biosynthesis